jgi:hypothetical protein
VEQSSSTAAHLRPGDRRDSLGQPASSVLAVVVPVRAAWMGENHYATAPSAIYGVILFMAAVAYFILQQCIIVCWWRASTNTAALECAMLAY